METQVAELNQTIEKLREQLATANGEKDKANQALGSVKAELDELQNDYNWLGDKYLWEVYLVEGYRDEATRLEGELTKANDDTSAFGEEMDKILDESVFDEVLPTTAE